MPLRILYENTLARNPAGTGVFVRGLLNGLRLLPDVEIVTADAGIRSTADLNVGQRSFTGRLRNALGHFRYYLDALPRQARSVDCDVILCPTSLGPLRGRVPSVVTLYDLAPMVVPETLDWISRKYVRTMFAIGVAKARCICTISQAVGREILKHYQKLTPERVFVAYPGPNPDLLQADPQPAREIEGAFVLMVGTLEPRKNHITALRALADHVRRQPTSELRLVLAGSLGWRYGPILQAIDELGLTPRVIRLGAIDVSVLKWLYLQAQALLFPSLYEGFGIPVLEAFSLGCPVIAARIPPVTELAGSGAALLLDPTDIQAWAAAIDAVAAGGLDGSLRSAGLARSSRFTWEACAREVLAAAREAASARSR